MDQRLKHSRRLRPFEERANHLPVMEILRGMEDMLHNQGLKSKAE